MDEAIGREIDALDKEMIAAGVREFACGLGSAKSLRPQPYGGVLITDGPYLETREHIGGFWISETADYNEMKTEILQQLAARETRSNELRTTDLKVDRGTRFRREDAAERSRNVGITGFSVKKRMQHVLFPEGVRYGNNAYETVRTCLLFSEIARSGTMEEDLVALPGIEPGF